MTIKVSLDIGAQAELAATLDYSLHAEATISTGYNSKKGGIFMDPNAELKDTSKPLKLENGCTLGCKAQLVIGPKVILSVGPEAPSWLAKVIKQKNDLVSLTVPEYTLSGKAGASIKAVSGATDTCDMCNAACPKIETDGELKAALAAKVSSACCIGLKC
jgi:hypothetical protein